MFYVTCIRTVIKAVIQHDHLRKRYHFYSTRGCILPTWHNGTVCISTSKNGAFKCKQSCHWLKTSDKVNCSTVSLLRPNCRYLPAISVVQGDCQWPPNLCFSQVITHGRYQPIWGHISDFTDSPNTTRLGLYSGLATKPCWYNEEGRWRLRDIHSVVGAYFTSTVYIITYGYGMTNRLHPIGGM